MKREVQLYIADTRVDLFKDESINITDSLQNILDISKIFTPFSQSFNLPASSTNNKLFEHYYNYHITDGFDARFQVDARIEINQVPFKKGKIRLDGVGMRNNLPYSYKVVFFGEPSNLNDLFGNEDLSSLNPLSAYDIEYNLSDLLNAFRTGLQSTLTLATSDSNRNIVLPLITLQNYYRYDTSGSGIANNLYTSSFALLKKELKPAIKLKRIIEAIETQYGITFNMSDEITDDFVLAENSDNVITEVNDDFIVLESATVTTKSFFGSEMFDGLYLWLHREKTSKAAPGEAYSGIDFNTRSKKLTLADFSYITGVCSSGDILVGGKLVVNSGESYSIRVRLDGSITSEQGKLIVKDKNTNELLYSEENVSFASGSTTTITITGLTSGTLDQRTYDIQFLIEDQEVQVFAANNTCGDEAMRIIKTVGGVATNHDYGNAGFTLGYNVYIQDYIPKMKIIDFLTGLFKMFNLVAYTKLTSDTIYVETFDNFMSAGTTRDITKYIDINESTIDRSIPYSRVNFRYSEPVTQTSLDYIDKFSQVFGDLSYSAPEKYDGESFEQKLPFERSVLINIQDVSTATTQPSDIIQGWWVDADDKVALGKPFIFFNRNLTTSNPIFSGTESTFNVPSNVSTDVSKNHTLNFNNEYDVYNKEVNTNSLFNRFYQQYIVQTFDKQNRIIKVKAQLPISFMLNYKLNDVIQIGTEEFYINSIRMNLTTGKSELELIVKTSTYTESVLS